MVKEGIADNFSVAKYWIFLFLVTLMIMISLTATYIFLRQEKNTTANINISGRQRMLSQQIPLYAQMMMGESAPVKRKELRDVLENTINLMEESHQFLRGGTVLSSSSQNMSDTIRGIFFSVEDPLDKVVSDYIGHARQLVLDWQSPDLERLVLVYFSREHSTLIVEKLDILVAQYQQEGEDLISFVVKVERAALLCCLLFFVAGVFYIFRMMTLRVQKQSSELEYSKESLNKAEHLTEQLRHALNEHSLVSITDVNGNIMYANSKFSEVSGFPISELINTNHRILRSGVHDGDFFRNLWKTINSGETWQGEICNKTKNGGLYWVFSTIVPFLNQDTQKPEYFVSVRTEITKQKDMQKNLDKLFVEALAANEVKTNFVTNMSHELRTPLNHIIGFSEILEMKTKDSGLLENVGYIKKAGHELLDKINAILTMVDQDDTRKDPSEVINITALVEDDFAPYFQNLAENAKRKFTKNIPEQGVYILANGLELTTAFRNVARNAVQFSLEGDIVGVSVLNDGEVVTIEIFDTGPGLPSHILTSNLEPFSIGERVITKTHCGMGLGLPLAKKLCIQNGGSLDMETDMGVGSKIIFSFPVAQSDIIQNFCETIPEAADVIH